MNEFLEEIVLNYKESDTIDFKSQFYHKAKKSELIKDIMSFANSHLKIDKYIFIGVDEKKDGFDRLTGNYSYEGFDTANIYQTIDENIEPSVSFDAFQIEIIRDNKKEKVTVIKINEENFNHRPFSMRKKTDSLDRGDSYIRVQTSSRKCIRSDYELFYATRKSQKIKIYYQENQFLNGAIKKGLGYGLRVLDEIMTKTVTMPTKAPLKLYSSPKIKQEELEIVKEFLLENKLKYDIKDISDFGNLGYFNMGISGTNWSGTDDEKEKYWKVQELIKVLNFYYSAKKQNPNEYFLVSLCIENCGSETINDLTLSVKLPKNKIYADDVDYSTLKGSYIYKFLQKEMDTIYIEDCLLYSERNIDFDIKDMNINDRNEISKDDFVELINSNIELDTSGNKILKVHFDKLRPGDRISLPRNIILKKDIEISEIEYELISDIGKTKDKIQKISNV